MVRRIEVQAIGQGPSDPELIDRQVTTVTRPARGSFRAADFARLPPGIPNSQTVPSLMQIPASLTRATRLTKQLRNPCFSPSRVTGRTRGDVHDPGVVIGVDRDAFELGRNETVELTIFDVAGRRVACLLQGGLLRSGPHTAVWAPAESTPRGIYMYQLRAGSWSQSGRIVLR